MTAQPESHLALTRRARRMNRELAMLYPDAHIELNFTTPLELSVATILSAHPDDRVLPKQDDVADQVGSGLGRTVRQ